MSTELEARTVRVEAPVGPPTGYAVVHHQVMEYCWMAADGSLSGIGYDDYAGARQSADEWDQWEPDLAPHVVVARIGSPPNAS